MKKGLKWKTDREKLLLERAHRAVYVTSGQGGELALHLFLPKDFRDGEPRAVLLFFHDGAWDRAGLVQFAPHALYYVERGAVAALVEYRNRATHPEARPSEAHHDGRAAIRYVRAQASELNVDPGKLVVIGAGSGANIAGAALLDAPLTPAEAAFSPTDSRPSAGVLLSAIFDVVKGGPGYDRCADAAEARRVSLSRLVGSGAPPLLVIHGNSDRLIPFEDAAAFTAKMGHHKNECRLVEFEGRDREFFDFNVDPVSFEAVLDEMDTFLDSCGVLKRKPGEKGPHRVSWREGDF